jgi:hypothetical protein
MTLLQDEITIHYELSIMNFQKVSKTILNVQKFKKTAVVSSYIHEKVYSYLATTKK